MIMGQVLSSKEFDKLSEITEKDIKEIGKDWESTAPDEFKELLNAEII